MEEEAVATREALSVAGVNGGGIMHHARRPGGPVAAAQNAPVPPIYLIRGASRTPTGPPALVMAPSSL